MLVASHTPHWVAGTWPATQACALTGNRTGNPLVHRPVLNPLSHTSQGHCMNFRLRVDLEPYNASICYVFLSLLIGRIIFSFFVPITLTGGTDWTNCLVKCYIPYLCLVASSTCLYSYPVLGVQPLVTCYSDLGALMHAFRVAAHSEGPASSAPVTSKLPPGQSEEHIG